MQNIIKTYIFKKIFKMLKILILFISLTSFLFPLSIKDKFLTAEKGDYIVTLQDTTYSLLLVQGIKNEIITLSEISIPKNKVKKDFSWRAWVEKNAPSNTSWNIYEIDLKNKKILKCFSVSRNSFLNLENNDTFFVTLLNLNLSPLENSKRKKIGPPPKRNEMDKRSLWNPKVNIDGKPMKIKFNVYRTIWPKDKSSFSLKTLDLYFKENFPFPFWIQVKGSHFELMLKTIDSGKDLKSSKTFPQNF
jgi:hypothetical protein